MNETTYIEKFLPIMEVITDKLAISPNGTIAFNGVAGYFENADWFWFALYNELREYMEKELQIKQLIKYDFENTPFEEARL